ncbi:DnaJ homolog subfamily C member 19 [uncultured Gammaproteobacteria bacterium]
MPLEDLVVLLGECRAADAQSTVVLERYLDRTQPTGWRKQAGVGTEDAAQAERGSQRAEDRPPMSREEAYEILGIKPGVSPEAIKEAHRRLIAGVHPDLGGSNYLAAKINQARDTLLKY